MARKFEITAPSDNVYRLPADGTVEMERSSAEIDYRIEGKEYTSTGAPKLWLTIDDNWFGEEDIDELINFLQAAKKAMADAA